MPYRKYLNRTTAAKFQNTVTNLYVSLDAMFGEYADAIYGHFVRMTFCISSTIENFKCKQIKELCLCNV